MFVAMFLGSEQVPHRTAIAGVAARSMKTGLKDGRPHRIHDRDGHKNVGTRFAGQTKVPV
jgi:hypothetical protein